MLNQILLDDSLIFATGGRRIIYQHPSEQNKLIKVDKPTDLQWIIKKKFIRRFLPKWYLKKFSENYIDYKAYKFYNTLSSEIFDFIPKSYGIVNTNLGEGFCTEKIVNYDGSLTITVEKYLKLYGFDDKLEKALYKLHEKMLKTNFIARELQTFNLVLRYTDKDNFDIYIIDGFGNPEKIKLSHIFKYIAKRKINKHFNLFINKIRP